MTERCVDAPVSKRLSYISNKFLRIALLEHDPTQVAQVRSWIEQADCQCTIYSALEDFQRGFYHMNHDLVIIDQTTSASVADQDVLHWIRHALGSTVPIVVISSNDEEREVVKALYAGADDYVVKPLRHNEFLARLHALIRRTRRSQASVSNAQFALIESNHQLCDGQQKIRLTKVEFELTAVLLRNRGRIVSREQLMASVWEESETPGPRTVDTHISRLRAKLLMLKTGRWNLASIRQRGYRLEEQLCDSMLV